MGKEKSNCENVLTKNMMLDADCIVCAAGFSSRMGRWKVDLMSRGGRSFLETALTAASVCRRVVLVGGYRFDELQKKVPRTFRGTMLENTAFQNGMLSTVQKALDSVEGYFFILPIDMPCITKEHLREVFQKREDERVVRPVFEGIPGHPVLCPPAWRERLLQGVGSSPSSVIKKEDQCLIPWGNDSVIMDVDSPEAYDDYLGRQL